MPLNTLLGHAGASAAAITAVFALLGGAIAMTGGDLPPYAPKSAETQLAQRMDQVERSLNDTNRVTTDLDRLHWQEVAREAQERLRKDPDDVLAQQDLEAAKHAIWCIDHGCK